MSRDTPMLQTASLSLRAGERLLVDRLDLQVAPGQCWFIAGRNGAGKSTLLRTLAGLHRSDAGSIELGGRPLGQWPLQALARQRAYLAQVRSDAFGYLAIDTVLAARHPYHDRRYWEGSDDHVAAYEALRAMQVEHLAGRDVRSLSGGERQRVAIAALLAQDTPLLLLDEPANALDLAHQVGAMQLLAQLCQERSKAVLMVGHDLNLAEGVATHALLLMGDGAWRAGTMQETMQPDLLGACLGHPVEVIQHGTRRIFVPGA